MRTEIKQISGISFLAVAGGLFTWQMGHRGVMMLDQCMVFDGGWRVLQGQELYRDFGAPFGPFTFWLQAIFFWLMGVNWSSMVAPAVLLNILSVPVNWYFFQKLFQGQSFVAPWMAAYFSAFFYYAAFGTQWFEVNGLFFVMLSQLLLVTGERRLLRMTVWDVFAGVSFFLAFLCKQNVAMFYTLTVVVLIGCYRQTIRTKLLVLLGFSVGCCIASIVFVLWLLWAGSVQEAVFYLVELPREIAAKRSIVGSLTSMSTMKVSAAILIAFLVVAQVIWRMRQPKADTHERPLYWFYAALFVSWAAMGGTTMNDGVSMGVGICLVFCGILGNCEAFVRQLEEARGRMLTPIPFRAFVIAASFVCVAGLTYYYLPKIYFREAQQFNSKSTFEKKTQSIEGLRNVLWGNPTLAGSSVTGKRLELRAEDIVRVYQLLRNAQGNFLVLGDATFLYGLVGKPSTSPLLYLMENHSYLARQRDELDKKILAKLQGYKVRFVIKELATYMPKETNQLSHFPQTQQWIHEKFSVIQQIGHFEVWAAQ